MVSQQRPARTAKALSTKGLSKNFNGVIAVSDVTVRFEANKVHAIIGPNGAGKTTFTNLLSGALPASAGSVQIDDLDVTGWPAHRIAHAGLGRSYQRTNIFPRFTVRGELRAGGAGRQGRAVAIARRALSRAGRRRGRTLLSASPASPAEAS